MYNIYLTNEADDDYKIIIKSVYKSKVEELLTIIRNDPFQNPPTYEKLGGNYKGAYSRRINLQHRLVYQVYTEVKQVKVLRMWSHYGDN